METLEECKNGLSTAGTASSTRPERPKVLSNDKWKALDEELQSSIKPVVNKAPKDKKGNKIVRGLEVKLLAYFIMLRQQISTFHRTHPGVKVRDIVGHDSRLWAYVFCCVSREDDQGTHQLKGILSKYRLNPHFLFHVLVHRKITRPVFNQELGWRGVGTGTEADRKATLKSILSVFAARRKRVEPINTACFTSSEEWDKLRPAIEVWSERSHPLMAEILAKHEAGDPMTDQEFCERLEQFPFIGDFLQWQMMLDFAYFSDGLLKRTDYLVPGPGAKEGMDMFQVDGVAANDYEAKFDYLLEHVNKELAKEKLERYEPGSTGTDARIVRFQIGPVDLEHALCEFQKYVTNVDRPLGRGHSKSRKTTEYKEVFGTRPRNNKRKSVDLESNSEAGTLVDTVEAPAKKARKQAPVKVEEEEALPASTRPRREVRSVVVVKEEVQVETKPAPKRKVKVEQEEESDEEDFEVEEIMDTRLKGKKREYYIKWLGYDESEWSWEPEANLAGCQAMLKAYKKKHGITA